MSVVSATSEEVSFVKAEGVGMNTEDSLGCSIIAAPMTEYDVVLEDAVAAVETIASSPSPATSPIERTEDRSSIAFSCPTVRAALMSPVAKSLPPPPTSPVIPGTKDSDGFLTPPPASTLLLRRTRTNSTGSSTYVIASSSLSPGPSTSKPAVVGVSGNGNVTALSHDVYAQSRKSFMKRSSRERDGNFVPGGRSNKKPKMDGKLSNILSAPSTHHNSQSRNSSSAHSTVFAQPHHPHFRPSIISPLALNPPQSLCVTITSQRSVSTFSPTPPATSPSSSSSFGFPVPEPGIPRKPVSRGKPAYITEIHSDACGKGSKGRSERVSDGKEIKRKVNRRKRLGWDKKGSRYRKRYYSESLNVYLPQHMGDWRPTDDLRLIVNILQTNSLKLVHRGVRFSCMYAIYNLRARWYALLYDKPTGKVSQAAIHKLHPKVVQDVYKKALFSKKEHALLKSIKSTHDLKCLLPKMEKLLHDNPLTFLKWRTPKVMAEEWLLLKDCQLLCDQDVRKYFEHENFNQFEASVRRRRRGRRLPRRLLRRKRRRDGGLRRELKLETRFARGRIRVLEEEVAHWQLIADMVTELDPNPFEEGSYAMLRGKQVRYLMRSREITLGRRSEFKTVPIDADLSLEGSTYKISRRQATIQLRTLGDFCIMNHGKHSFFVDGRMVEPGKMDRLFDQSVIEISRLRFIFIVNTKVLNDYISKQIRIEVKREMCDLQKLARAIKAASAASSAGGTSPTSAAAAHLYALTAQSGVVDAVLAASGYPSPKYEDGTTPATSPSSCLNSVPNSLALALSSMISLSSSSGTSYKPQANSRPVSPATSSLTFYSNSIAAAAAALSRCPTPSPGSSFAPYSNSIAAAAAALSRSPTLSASSSFAPYSNSIAAGTTALSRSTPPAGSSFTPSPYSSSLAAAAAALSRSPTPSAGSSSRSGSPALSSSTSTGSRSNSPAFPAARQLDSSNSVSPTFFGPSAQPGISSQRAGGSLPQFGIPPTTSNSTPVVPVTSAYDSTLAVIDAVASGVSPLPPVPSPLTLALTRPPIQSPIVRPYIQPPPYAGVGHSNQRIPITIYRNSSPPPPTNLSQPQQQQHPMQITTFPPSSMEPPISSPVQFGDLTIRPGLPPPPQPQTQQEPAAALK